MQRNPSQTPADLALPSRFICSKLPPLTHVANLLSVGFFIYLETAEQILSQCSLSQLLWLPARGFIPAEGPCSLLAGIRGCRINRGVYPGVCSQHTQTDQTSLFTPCTAVRACPPPGLTCKKSIVWPGGKCLEMEHEVCTRREGGSGGA